MISNSLLHFVTRAFDERKNVFCTENLTSADTKPKYFKFSRLTDLKYSKTNLIFLKPLVFHFVKQDSFYEIILLEGKINLLNTERLTCTDTKSKYFKFSGLLK